MPDPVLDLATVVYRRELDLLRLQARSIDLFLAPEGIGRILVVVNDIDEDACAAGVEALRSDYGRFADRLEVLRPDALLARRPAANGPRGPRQRFRLWLTRNRRRYPAGVKSGWRGNRGWSVQQALKLAVARDGDSPFLLVLDAKNHFVAPVGLGDFVSPRGRARSRLDLPSERHRTWIAGSFRLLGVAPPVLSDPAPPTVTPFCVPRATLLGCLDVLERRVGPAEAFFARARGDTSEFALIHAYVAGHCGGWQAVFDPGLAPAASIHRKSDADDLERVLALVEGGAASTLSVHDSRRASLAPEFRRRLEAIWRDRGLPSLWQALPAEPSAAAPGRS